MPGSSDGKETTNMPRDDDSGKGDRFRLAKTIIYLSISILVLLIILLYILTAIQNKTKDSVEPVQSIFNVILPLIGTWVGAILAYYFSRENFESANRNVREIVGKLTTTEKLMSIPVKSKMIPKGEIELPPIAPDTPEDKINLKGDILDKCKRNRILLLGENDHPQYMIHRSMIDKYLTKKAFEQGQTPEKLNSLTLKDLLEDSELKGRFDFGRGFMTVKEDGTLADAKREMDKAKECLDVFVTKNGTKDELVIGWITNLIITENATV